MSTQSSATNAGLASVGGGAAAGAAIGTAVAPGVGTLIGGAIGAAVGGVASAFGFGNKAKKYQKKAKAVQKEREGNAQAEQYLQMVRQARQERAGSLAAATYLNLATDSLTTAALSSIGSQSQHNVQFTANDERLITLYNKYMKKAGAYASAAKTTMTAAQITSTAFSLGAAGAAASAAGTSAMAANAVGPMGPVMDTAAYNAAFSSTLQTGMTYTSIGQNVLGGFNQNYL